jgi:asparagine synthase (glutamine-hydrolysing)
MCGIAGAFDLTGHRQFPEERLLRMTGALAHRGPNDEHLYREPGIALGVRRLSVIDVANGRQPLCNESGDVWVAYEGELYDYPEIRERLLGRGHRLRTRCDTEAWVHLYEDLGEKVFAEARGQFGVALWDRKRRTVFLGRDRIGISPLFYAEAEGWLLWASEIKGLLASGMITPRPDVRGLDYFFNFFCSPMWRTAFAGISSVGPGHYIRVHNGRLTHERYWDLDFPDKGAERRFDNDNQAAEELEAVLRGAVRRRLCGEVPLSCYISGGLDSTVILGLSSQEKGEPIPSFTISLDRSGPADERSKAAESAHYLGSKLTTVTVTPADLVNRFPDVIGGAEGPVLDTSCVGTLMLAAANRQAGNTVALTGEGADEALAGYVWYKYHRIQRGLHGLGRLVYEAPRRIALSWLIGGGAAHRPPFFGTGGVRTAQQIAWEFMAQSREYLYTPELWQRLNGYSAYDDVAIPERMRRWHPLNQSLYTTYRTMMPGLLMAAKGDRSTRFSATEGRYPLLDERVVEFCAGLAPHYKLRGWTDKYLLRRVAARVLPPPIARRSKTMFRANLARGFVGPDRPDWIDQLLTPDSLRTTGYFDPFSVQRARDVQLRKSKLSLYRFALDMGLMGVIATQLWHHTYCGGGLCELPTWTPPDLAQTRLFGRREALAPPPSFANARLPTLTEYATPQYAT